MPKVGCATSTKTITTFDTQVQSEIFSEKGRSVQWLEEGFQRRSQVGALPSDIDKEEEVFAL